LPNVGPYIYDVSISGFTRSSIYIYDISSLRVNDAASNSDRINSNVSIVVNMEMALGRRPRDEEVA